MKLRSLLIVLISACALASPAAGGKKSHKKYEYVQVNRFDVQQGVDFPVDYQLKMVEDLINQLGKIKGVRQVLREGETLPQGQPVLLITGTVTKFKKGSQAARYLAPGAGATVIATQVKCYDAATKELLLDHKVQGSVRIGVMGGKSEGATNGIAKGVAKMAEDNFF
jgi:hypothetical protein